MLRQIRSVHRVAWSRWLTDTKTRFGLIVLVLFSWLTYAPLNDVVDFLGVKASPWIFVWFLSPTMLPLVYAGVCILVYSDTMIINGYSQLEMIRTGRKAFLWGQIVFILFSALFIVAIPFVLSFIIVLPSVHWDTEWGNVFRTIAESASVITQRSGVEMTFVLFPQYMDAMGPIASMLLNVLLMWLYTVFTALLIGCFRVLTGRNTGVAAAGLAAAFSYFSRELGALAFGDILHYFAPLYWASPIYLNWYGMEYLPTFAYVLVMFIGSIILMAVLSMIRFVKGDIHDQSTNS